jgi:hypothetical protein
LTGWPRDEVMGRTIESFSLSIRSELSAAAAAMRDSIGRSRALLAKLEQSPAVEVDAPGARPSRRPRPPDPEG